MLFEVKIWKFPIKPVELGVAVLGSEYTFVFRKRQN